MVRAAMPPMMTLPSGVEVMLSVKIFSPGTTNSAGGALAANNTAGETITDNKQVNRRGNRISNLRALGSEKYRE
jgi:hypothetical protein